MNGNLITAKGKKELEEELKYLISVRRVEIIKQLQAAREQGDLSENADYEAAKNAQAQNEMRISELQDILSKTKIIKKATSRIKKKVISIGSWVTFKDYSDAQEHTFKIVGHVEADPEQNKISNMCALAKSIMGKSVHDEVVVKAPKMTYKVQILAIENND